MRLFLLRLLYYSLYFGFVLLVGAPILIPPISGVIVLICNGYNVMTIEWLFDTAWRIMKVGLVVTPPVSFLAALCDYSRCRGWNQTITLIVVVSIGVLLIATGAYITRGS